MNIKLVTIKVIIPDEGKCLKITQNGKILMYMKTPYYQLPEYDYQVEEVDIKEGEIYMNKHNNNMKKIFSKIKSFHN